MKIVLVTKNPPFYENTIDRKSYIKIINKNVVLDASFQMRDTQKSYFSQYFTNDENLISDNFNLITEDMFIRTTYLEPKNYPDNFYPNNFEYWNNVSYAKIIYDNDFIEYCYISARRCMNLVVNKWYFTLTVDTWNTYWIDTYAQIKRLSNFPILITRGHFDRFDYDEKNKVLSFKFLKSQDNAFWNNEQFETSITSRIPIQNGITYTPFSEENDKIIPKCKEMKNIFNLGQDNLTVFYNYCGRGFPLIFLNNITQKGGYNSWDTNNYFYGVPNTYWILPLVNRDILDFSNKIYKTDQYRVFLDNYDDNRELIWTGNIIDNIINSPSLASYIITPKPTFNISTISKPYLYNDIAYPIRYRDKYSLNNNKYFLSSLPNIQQAKLILKVEDGKLIPVPTVVFASSSIPFGDTPLNYQRDYTSSVLADERIEIKHTPIMNLARQIDLSTFSLIRKVIIDNEPKLYDEKLFNIEYSRYSQSSITISPKWYYYNNLEDILIYRSLFLLGYQFVQPHICILTTGPISGLYGLINADGSRNLVSQFSPQQQTVTDAEQQFLISNRSQLNTGLNNTLRSNQQGFIKSVVGGVGGVIGGAIGGFAVGGPAGAAAGIAGGLFAGTMGVANNRIQAQNAQDMYNARLEDLANTPNATNDHSTESTFKDYNSFVGLWRLNWINEVDKRKILAFHQQQGYFLNKFVTWYSSSGQGFSSFATRQFYNFWQIPEFKMLIQTSGIAPEYQQYFQTLFSNSGVTLWHTYVTPSGNTYDTVADYSNENWELSLAGFLGD